MGKGHKPDKLYFEMKFDREAEQWQLKKEGSDKVLDSAGTKKDLMRAAREHAESKHAHLRIYRLDGSLEVETDYTKDSPSFDYPDH